MLNFTKTLVIFANIALTLNWWVGDADAKHITSTISKQSIIKALLTVSKPEEGNTEPITEHEAILHLIYSTQEENPVSGSYEKERLIKDKAIFSFVIPQKAGVSLLTRITDADLKKYVLPAEKKEGEEEVVISESERLSFFKKLIAQSDMSTVTYQPGTIKGSFTIWASEVDDNSRLVKYNFFTSEGYESLPVSYIGIWTKLNEEQIIAEEKKLLKDVVMDPYKVITIPAIPVDTVTKVYKELQSKLDETDEEKRIREEKERRERERIEAERERIEEEKKKKDAERKEKERKEKEAKDKEKKGKTPWYKSGWFIALIVIFIVLVITGIVLTVLMVNSKDKTLDYTS